MSALSAFLFIRINKEERIIVTEKMDGQVVVGRTIDFPASTSPEKIEIILNANSGRIVNEESVNPAEISSS